MPQDVVLILGAAGALLVINVEQSIAEDAGIGDPILSANFKAVGGQNIPRE